MNEIAKKVLEGKNLSIEEATRVMDWIMSGEASEAQIGSYLTALRMKGETIEEITGSAKGMREKCLQLKGEGNIFNCFSMHLSNINVFEYITIICMFL